MNIRVENVYKVFGTREKEALKLAQDHMGKDEILQRTACTLGLANVSLEIASGKIFVIMGLSGSGKSTLVRHFNGLIQPSSGHVLVGETDVSSLSEAGLRELRRSKISMVFQTFGLLPHKTTLENTAFGLLTRGEPVKAALETATAWLEKVGLQGYEQKYPDELSGGMKQRVGLARALAANTDVLLMDEAFSALDPLIRAEMQDQLLELQQTLGKTIVFITHDLDEALRLGSEIAILRGGLLVQVGTPQEILSNPANDYVAKFVQKRAAVLSTT